MEMALPTPNETRVLKALDASQPRRFTDIEGLSGLQPTQVSRALESLVGQQWVLAQVVGEGQYPVKVRYRLSPMGDAVRLAVLAYDQKLKELSQGMSPGPEPDRTPLEVAVARFRQEYERLFPGLLEAMG